MSDRRAGRSRWIALSLLVLTLAVAAALVLTPLHMAFSRYDDAIEALSLRLQRYQRTAAMAPALQQRTVRQGGNTRAREGLIEGESQAIAEANLQALLKEIVQRAGGELESTQALDVSVHGSLERLAVRAHFNGDVSILQQILYQIELARSGLLVEQLEIRRRKPRRFNGRARPPAGPQQLQVAIDVAGYRQAGRQP